MLKPHFPDDSALTCRASALPNAKINLSSHRLYDCGLKPFDVERLESILDLPPRLVTDRRRQCPRILSAMPSTLPSKGDSVQRLTSEAGESVVLLRAEGIEWSVGKR